MDPNATLAQIRSIIVRGEDESELVDLVDALDTWLESGGFLPDSWRR